MRYVVTRVIGCVLSGCQNGSRSTCLSSCLLSIIHSLSVVMAGMCYILLDAQLFNNLLVYFVVGDYLFGNAVENYCRAKW